MSNQYVPIRRSPTNPPLTNPSGPYPGLMQVPEGNSTDILQVETNNVSASTRHSPNMLPVPQNDVNSATPKNVSNSPIPHIKLIPPGHTTASQKSILTESTFSDVTISDPSSSFEEQSAEKPLHNVSVNKINEENKVSTYDLYFR